MDPVEMELREDVTPHPSCTIRRCFEVLFVVCGLILGVVLLISHMVEAEEERAETMMHAASRNLGERPADIRASDWSGVGASREAGRADSAAGRHMDEVSEDAIRLLAGVVRDYVNSSVSDETVLMHEEKIRTLVGLVGKVVAKVAATNKVVAKVFVVDERLFRTSVTASVTDIVNLFLSLATNNWCFFLGRCSQRDTRLKNIVDDILETVIRATTEQECQRACGKQDLSCGQGPGYGCGIRGLSCGKGPSYVCRPFRGEERTA